MWIDSHAHLSTPSLQPHLQEMLIRAANVGVEAIINVCTSPSELESALTLRTQFPCLYVAGSTTPHDAEKNGEEDFEAFASQARKNQLIAVGETGLDYYYYKETAEKQKVLLRRYLALALEMSLPVIIHCRDAFSDLIEILDESYKNSPGVLHCFTGTLEEARQLIERGWFISFSGIVTFKKSEALREVARFVPLDRLLIETDTPYLAPHSKRGACNEPSFLPETALCLAETKKISTEHLSKATCDNARILFRLK